MPPRARLALIGLAGGSLVAGVWLGLHRMGLAAALPLREASVLDHGPVMVSGFLGTVIALERAVALRRGWGYLAPLLNALGSAVMLASPSPLGPLLLTLGSGTVLLMMVQVLRLDRALHHQILTAATVSWLIGNLLLLRGLPVFDVVVWWLGFLVLTIAAERLELSRLLRPPLQVRVLFVGAVALLLAGAALSAVDRDWGWRAVGAGSLGLAAWMLRYDVARRTVRMAGAVRYIAAALLLGYLWLAVAGVLALRFGHPVAGPVYDALLHAVFVGFVFSMIFGHALVIVPAVLGVQVRYRPRFYLHLGLLHLSLLLRVSGDLLGLSALRSTGAWLNVAAIALFAVFTVLATRKGDRTKK